MRTATCIDGFFLTMLVWFYNGDGDTDDMIALEQGMCFGDVYWRSLELVGCEVFGCFEGWTDIEYRQFDEKRAGNLDVQLLVWLIVVLAII